MKRAYATSIVVAFLAILGGAILFGSSTACSNQGEGERCEVLNGNDDCSSSDDLICYPATQLTNTTSDRCCPIDRAKATAPVCQTPLDIGSDGGAPADTGPGTTADATVGDADVADTGSTDDGSTDASDAASE